MIGNHPSRRRPGLATLRGDRRGVALIEMALALPVLILLLFAIVSYGSWLALAHMVQQGANEAARAAIAGLSPGERAMIAQQAASEALARSYGVPATAIAVAVQDDGTSLAVTVAYDASSNALLSMPIVPQPPTRIARTAAMRLNRL